MHVIDMESTLYLRGHYRRCDYIISVTLYMYIYVYKDTVDTHQLDPPLTRVIGLSLVLVGCSCCGEFVFVLLMLVSLSSLWRLISLFVIFIIFVSCSVVGINYTGFG